MMSILTLLLRGSILPGIALACLPLLSRAPASARRLLLSLSLSAALFLPFVSELLPETSPARVALPALHEAFVEPVSVSAGSVARVAARLSGVSDEQIVWSWEACVWALWALGALLVIAGVITARLRVQHMLRAASRVADDVVISDAFTVPAVVGVWPSTIVLPRESLFWCAERRRAVLAHERAHIAQRDALVQLLAQLACAAYWSVPWVWWAARRLRRECELSADARVVASGVPATSYADHLIAIARNAVDAMPQGAIGMASELEQRICALVLPSVRPWSRGRLAALSAGMLIPAWFLACLNLGPHHARASAGHAGPGIDARLQGIADEEAERASKEWSAEDVMVVVLDPSDGAVLARSGETGRALVPGSTVKPFTVAAALEAKRLEPDATLECCSEPRKYGKKTIRDSAKHSELDLRQTLAMSSNICTSHIYDAVGGQRLLNQFHALHLGDAPGALPEVLADGSFEGALVALGDGLKVTPEQIAAAYAALRDGNYRAPALSHGNASSERVMSAETASTVRNMLEEVVYGEHGTGKAAAVSNARVSGKTGTMDFTDHKKHRGTFASFVGLVPAEAPRYVIFVGVLGPRDQATGGQAAAPVFSRIASRALTP